MIYGFLMHLGSNMWRKKGEECNRKKDEEDFIFREQLCCDREVWRKVTDFLPTCGINTLVIDVADGVKLESHPEIAVAGAWSREELKTELVRLRSIGLTPIPKCNFSCAHNAWMKEYAYMVGSEPYNQFCRDVVNELIDLFDGPEFFHLGLEEEDYTSQKNQPIAIIRAPYKKTEDALALFEVCRAKGVRPWIWCDPRTVEAFGGAEAFRTNIPKDVMLSGWYYGSIRRRPDIEKDVPIAQFYLDAAEWGYEQIPTGSTWEWHLNHKDIMHFCKERVPSESIQGYLSAPWMLTMPNKLYALINDAYTFYNAKREIYGE